MAEAPPVSIGGAARPAATVIASTVVKGRVFSAANQTARAGASANPQKPTLIASRVSEKEVKSGKAHPNGNMATAHAEVAVIQQAFDAGVTKGADMVIKVTGKPVCSYCRGDVAAMAQQAGLNSLTVREVTTGNTLVWQPGMRSLIQKVDD